MIKDKVEPYPSNISPYRSYEVHEIKTISRQGSPIPSTADDREIPTTADDRAIPITADDRAIPIITPPTLTPLPRVPTPPAPTMFSVTVEKSLTPPSSPLAKDLFSFPQKSAFVVDFDKVRRGRFLLR